MPPDKFVEDVLSTNLTNLAEYRDINYYYEERSREMHGVVSHGTIQWVDLHPCIFPLPERPPNGEDIVNLVVSLLRINLILSLIYRAIC